MIVGAGVAGLAAAWHLHRAGVRDLVLLELEDAAGGNARAGASSVTGYPWGAHYLPLPGSQARGVRALLRELGVIEGFGRDGHPIYDERHLCHAPQERLFIHGRWQEGVFPALGATAEDRAQHEAFRREMDGYRRWRDAAGRRGFATPRAAGAPGAFRELDDDLDGRVPHCARLHLARACAGGWSTRAATISGPIWPGRRRGPACTTTRGAIPIPSTATWC